jgi:hypothetical protein
MRLLALLMFAGVFVAGLGAQQKFDPRDLSGHWDRTSPVVSFSNVPGSGRGAPLEAPFTPEGKKMNDANKPGYGPRRGTTRNDPLGRCEPLGLVRHLSTEIVEPHNTFEIVQLPNRILQFFEYRHDWREIWMDGRALPDPAKVDPKWNGFSVGRWEGDALVVDSVAFDRRSWVDKFGYPHSEEMRLQERYRRVDADTLELVMTITDPVVYSKPWSSDVKRMKLNREQTKRWDEQIYCVPSEEFPFQRLIQSGNVIEP